VVATATELARFTGQHLITPQTILARDYLEQIFAGLRDAESAVFHVLLDADQKYCASASVPPTKHGPDAWRIWPTTRRRVRGCSQQPTFL